VPEEELSWVGELHASRCTYEQRRAEFVFETSNLTGDRWLGDSKTAGCAAHMAFIGDGDEVLDLREAHVPETTPTLARRCSASAIAKRYWTRGADTRRVHAL
jgi:hypothetical protein